MADNFTLNSGTGGVSLAADDVSSVFFQRVKPAIGADGAATDVSVSNPMPVGGGVAHDDVYGSNFAVPLGGYAKAAAPSDVSADADFVRAWFLRNGAQATALTAAGALIGGDATNGIDCDVTRLGGSDVAHDAGDSGNPHKIGFKARNAFPTAVSNGDRADGSSDLWGRQMTTHIDPAQMIWKSVNVTTTQTGTDIWSPTSGKKIALCYLAISAYATTAARVIVWFGDNADTTYTAGTDQLIWAGSFAPSATSKPGAIICLPVGSTIFCTTADREIHLTTDAGISLDIVAYGYEW